MKPIPPSFEPRRRSRFTRRRFAFWVGLGLFGLSERLGAESLDSLAAAVMRATDSDQPGGEGEHWTLEENELWYWFERQTFIDEVWKLSGRTRPVHKHSGRRGAEQDGYLDDEAVPVHVRRPRPERDPDSNRQGAIRDEHETRADAPGPSAPGPSDLPGDPGPIDSEETVTVGDAADASPPGEPGEPSCNRRARHGRPPSRWLRSLQADELRTWLATVEVPEAGVSGMTFWVHLTRDHLFDPERIAGLTTEEQAQLHAAAHHGY